MLRRVVVLALSVVLVVGVVDTAGAALTKRTISAENKGTDGLKGQVKSSKEKCFKKAFVQVFDQTNMQVTSFFTNEKGKWKTRIELAPGNYYAVAPKLDGCKKATSETVLVGPIR